jgi:dTDP-D-glucose 4,6-dehydratase
MTTLVTGAFGCIRAWVVRGLLAAGERPVLFDLGDDPGRLRMLVGPDVAGRATLVRGDIADRDQVTRAVLDHAADRIIHLAAWPVPACRQAFAEALDDARFQKDLGPAPRTRFRDGLRATLETFARLQKEGRLDARELA